MNAFRRIIFLVAVLILPLSSQASDGEADRESLRGVKAFAVVVEPTDQTGLDIGLSTAQLQTATELKMRLAGIKVVSDEASVALPGRPYLYINVLLLGKPPGVIAFTVRVSLEQLATLESNPKTKPMWATTWSASMIATVGSATAAEAVMGDLAKTLDKFLNAYLSVNPK